MYNYYRIVQTGHIGYAWSLPADLLGELVLREGDMVNLRFGSANTWAIIYLFDSWNESNKRQMGFSSELLENLAIPKNISVMVKPEGSNSLRLGPVIGILAPQRIVTGKKFHYYNRSAVINKNNGLLYVFSGKDIDIRSRTIIGHYYDYIGGIWKNHRFPFPDAVMDRCYPNNYSYHKILEEGNRSKIFNKKNRIDKMEFFNALNCDSFLKNHVPDTQLIEEISDFEYFLEKYNELYLKPIDSMKGFGIIYAKSVGAGLVECGYMKNGENCWELINTTEIFKVLETAAGCKRRYIMQRAVDSMKYKKGLFSIRAWAMKDGNGNWVVPGMDARGTYGNGFLTNISAGAKAVPLKNIFNTISDYLSLTKDQLLIKLEDITLKTAEILDQEYGPLGILGLDIMIDKEGRIWVIEANGNPGKSAIIKQKDYFSWATKVYQYPLAYAAYLAGFGEDTILKHETSDLASRHPLRKTGKKLVRATKYRGKFTKSSVGLIDKILREYSSLEINAPDEVEIKKNTDYLNIPDIAPLHYLNHTNKSSVYAAKNKEQFIKPAVVLEEKTLKEFGSLEIKAPDEFKIEKNTDYLTKYNLAPLESIYNTDESSVYVAKNKEQFINPAVVHEEKILQDFSSLEINTPDEVEIKNTDYMTKYDLAPLQSLNNIDESSVYAAENKKQFIKPAVVPEEKNPQSLNNTDKSPIYTAKNKNQFIKPAVVLEEKILQAVGMLEIIAPEGVGIEKNTGNLTVPVLLEVCGDPVLNSEVINDLLIYEGSIPAKLSVDKNTKLSVPFQLISEVKGIKPEDNLQEKIVVGDTSVLLVPGFENKNSEKTKVKLLLKIMLQIKIMITREYDISIPARMVDATLH